MNKIISFPHLGSYYIPISYIIKSITNCEVLIPNKNNKETIMTGSKYSPNDICMPFKYNLGNYIEALNKGATILIQAGGGCRYGYFAELQEQILKELGYKFTFINLIQNNHVSLIKLYKESKKINKRLNVLKYIYYIIQGFLIIIYMDKINKYYRENRELSNDPNKYDLIIKKMNTAYSSRKLNIKKIVKTYYKYKKELMACPKKENVRVTKILLIGELYTLMDSEANHSIEKRLLASGSVVYRHTDLTYLLIKKKFKQNKLLQIGRKYLKYSLGADGAASVAHTISHIKSGIDGIIHIKSYGCVPELNAIPILSQISEDNKVPILYLSYDGENNIANIDTKIEAFYDMIRSKNNKF